MGALHKGHLELVKRARQENEVVACSIFVNHMQFNNAEDLEKYPRTPEEDHRKLEEMGCDLVFSPSTEEMYPSPVKEKYDFGPLERVMEGKFRPGHFNGVAIVVKKLFDIINPDKAYFGKKDYQQLKIIQALVKMENMHVQIIPCETVREVDGLAMSSRNFRLSTEERIIAPEIYRTLTEAKENLGKIHLKEIEQLAIRRLERAGFIPDYFEIVDAATLMPVKSPDEAEHLVACVACYLGKVRLIDNLEII